MNQNTLYFHPTVLGPDCSTERTARLRQRRFDAGYLPRPEPPEYTRLSEETRQVFLEWEQHHPALGRAKALEYVVQHCPITLEPDILLVGGEDPFFFNLMLPALNADLFSQVRSLAPDDASRRLRDEKVFSSPCFEGHITPGLEQVLGLGITGIRARLEEGQRLLHQHGEPDHEKDIFYQAGLIACLAVLNYTQRYRQEAEKLAAITDDASWAVELRKSAAVLAVVPEQPAHTLREALQAYWIVYILVTLEMGGCTPGGGLGLGRLDQYLYPFYARDLETGIVTRAEALELIEQFLLCFRHVDYYTWHQQYTPGSQSSLGGVTPTGADACNDLTEIILEASQRINMPAPYLSLRLYRDAPERWWEVAGNYIASGLGFPVVNDEVLIPAMLRHGRSLADARDYICSCCYEHTIPGREAFHPSCCFVNLPVILELALNQGHSIHTGAALGMTTPSASTFASFDDLLAAFWTQLHFVLDRLAALTNQADVAHSAYRRYPLMSLFIDDCTARAQDVCAGGARYNLTGCVVGGLPNTVNSLAAIRKLVYEDRLIKLTELVDVLKTDFSGYEDLQRKLLVAPKWGNGIERVDSLAGIIVDRLYAELSVQRNGRGGRWQLGLYSFVANHWMGQAAGASADGRKAGESLTRNLNPSWGTDRKGPTAVLNSLSAIDFTTAPDGCALDLRFDPVDFISREARQKFTGFLKAFVELGIMQVQISMVDTATLIDAQAHPDHYPHLLVKVAGFSARFIDLSPQEQAEIIGRTNQRI
jgi:pyruvate-formate lyase